MDKDTVIFGNHTLSTLMEEAYINVKNRDSQINGLIEQIKDLIKSGTSASFMVPIVREYLDAAVANNDQLVKVVTIIQKMIAVEGNKAVESTNGFFTSAERQQLLDDLQVIAKVSTKKELPDAKLIKLKSGSTKSA